MFELFRVELEHRDRRVGHEHLKAHRPPHRRATALRVGHDLRCQLNAPGAEQSVDARVHRSACGPGLAGEVHGKRSAKDAERAATHDELVDAP